MSEEIVRIVTDVTAEPVTLAEVKEWCRIDADDTAQDTVLGWLIQAARRRAELITLRAFMPRTLELIRPCWDEDGDGIELPFAPLRGVDWVKYLDIAGTLQTLDPSLYDVDTDSEPGRVRPAWLAVYPSTRPVYNAVRVQYRAGYAAVGSPEDADAYRAGLPSNLKAWMAARISTLFENREQLVINNMMAIPEDFADGMLDDLVLGDRIA